jgi:hypothetical protein
MDKIRIMEASVRKWNRIIDGQGTDGGVLDCPPCRIYYMLVCNGCPIADYTGKKFCKHSPYGPWYRHQMEAHGKLLKKVYCPECVKLAIDMRDFMIEIFEHLKSRQADSPRPEGRRAGSRPHR